MSVEAWRVQVTVTVEVPSAIEDTMERAREYASGETARALNGQSGPEIFVDSMPRAEVSDVKVDGRWFAAPPF